MLWGTSKQNQLNSVNYYLKVTLNSGLYQARGPEYKNRLKEITCHLEFTLILENKLYINIYIKNIYSHLWIYMWKHVKTYMCAHLYVLYFLTYTYACTHMLNISRYWKCLYSKISKTGLFCFSPCTVFWKGLPCQGYSNAIVCF